MIRDAEKYAEHDAAATERINAVTAMENYLDAAEKPLKDGGYEKLSEDQRSEIQAAVKEGRAFLQDEAPSSGMEKINKRKKEIEQKIAPIIESIYGKTDTGGGDDDDDDGDY